MPHTPSPPDPRDLLRDAFRAERARRDSIELARRRLLAFAQMVKPDYETPPHIVELAEALEAVETGALRRLMVFEPPRHGKSCLVSQIFPCWVLGRRPGRQIVQSGYSQALTSEHSRRAREIFRGEAMQCVFPEVFDGYGEVFLGRRPRPNDRYGHWGTYRGGSYYAVGVGGSLTGRGADLAIVDDPVKNRQAANNERARERVWDWFRSTLYTRLSPGGAIILVMTRWHVDDLAGRLLAELHDGDAEPWRVISLPAIGPDGAALWPERWPAEKLHRVRTAIGPYEWEALYQQHPVVPSGNLFRIGPVRLHTDPTDFPEVRYVRFWDLASTSRQVAKNDPDYTVGALVGLTEENGPVLDAPLPPPRDALEQVVRSVRPARCIPAPDAAPVHHLWVRDLVVGRWNATERNAIIRATAERDGPGVTVLVEAVGGYKDTADLLRQALLGIRTVVPVTVTRDKVARAAPLEPLFEAGHVHLLAAPWNDPLLAQFREFPHGSHDDIVDAVAGAYAHLLRPRIQGISRRMLGF
jgi:predicted phage terminase large subunit-like protein